MAAYASVADVEALMGSPVDEARTTTLLDLAAEMINAYAPKLPGLTPPPPAARIVNANMVVRVLTNPLGVKSEQLASYSTTYGDATAGMSLSADDMAMLDAIPALHMSPVYSIETPRADVCGGLPPAWWVVDVVPGTRYPVDVSR